MAARNLEIPINPPALKFLFKNNSIWLPNDSDSVSNGEMCYETSTRIDKKRPHQQFMDSSEQERLLSKKLAVEPFTGTSGSAVMESSLWHDSFHFQSGTQTPGLFSPKPVQSSNVSDNNISPFTASMNMDKDLGNQFEDDPSICLTASHVVNSSLCLDTGPRKVKVSKVSISENCLPEFVGSTSSHGEKNEILTSTFQWTGNNMCSEPTYNTTVGNAISVNPAYSTINKNCVSLGNSSNKRLGNFMLTNQYYNGIDSNVLSIGENVNRVNFNVNALAEQHEKDNVNFSSIWPTYNRGQVTFFTSEPVDNKGNGMFMSTGPTKGDKHIAFQGQQGDTIASLGTLYDQANSSILSIVEHSKKGEETTISFGGFPNNVERDHSGRLISSYDIMLNQSSSQPSGALGQNGSTDQLSANAIPASSSRADGVPKNKDQRTKKGSSNNFPSNVKSLLSTGILDGVPVKYVSWSREKNLRGVVKGTGYLCSCQDCKLLKTINAYEFERHAGCKTKHPNNHIYFENGKTIYAVVQELKSTPQEMLFDVIQNVTGSAINQKNFNAWKASYQAATRELQRIYGKDDLVVPS